MNLRTLLKQHDMVYETAPLEWDQGFLLGSGDLGAVIWGDGAPININLTRMDTWDERDNLVFGPDRNYQSLRKLLDNGKFSEADKLYNTHREWTGLPYPTNIIIGGINLEFGSKPKAFKGRLNLFDARMAGTVFLNNGEVKFSGFIHPQKNLLVLETDLEGDATFEYTQDFDCKLVQTRASQTSKLPISAATLKTWGYPRAMTGNEGVLSWHVQQIPDNGAYCIIKALQEDLGARHFTLILGIEFSTDDPLSAARDRMDEALKLGVETLYEQHCSWWQKYWEKSALTIPDSRLENLYYVEMYKLACNSIGQVPQTTQGVWSNQAIGTSDGTQSAHSYHLDLNIQESYWPIYTSNHLELGDSLYNVFFEMLPRLQGFCRDFYGWDGAMADLRLTPKGAHVPCDYPWNLWTGSGPWLAHHFWLHYLYSKDETFLREKAYPFMREFMKFFVGYLEKGDDGLYHLPWDCSPEYEGMGWDVTCSLALVRFLAEALLKSQDILRLNDPEASAWKEILDNLVPYPEDQTGLLIMKDTPLSHSHRHHSHLMPIHPLGLLNINGGEEERSLINRSINTWLREGFGEWIGEVFPWASLIASRIQKGNMAFMFLEHYAKAFISENTLNMNSDCKEYGLGGFPPKVHGFQPQYGDIRWSKEFSINGGFGAAAALLEMLLQSWTGIIEVFPALPDHWQDAYFENLRTEGAFLISSQLSEGKISFIDVTSEIGGMCRVHNPWSTCASVTSFSEGKICLIEGDTLEFSTCKGDSFRLTPEAVQTDNSELNPPNYKRSSAQINWFGVKKAPRY